MTFEPFFTELNGLFARYLSSASREAQHSYCTPENRYRFGSQGQVERLIAAAELCTKHFSGDLVEIGCFEGSTSKHLCKVAKQYSRKLICVDPWETGTQNCEGSEYNAFLEATKEYRDTTEIIRKSSMHPDVVSTLRSREIAFAYVDGLHTLDACFSDIKTVGHCYGIIAVDDLPWCREVRQAIAKSLFQFDFEWFGNPYMREGYLFHRPKSEREFLQGTRDKL
ncbi:MAG: class I SAM-dependent methyltransferase [Bdellovibrionales bacterium]|nr:class I SAM-dependent methyltransferase [Bdellovibrionales bacterium]